MLYYVSEVVPRRGLESKRVKLAPIWSFQLREKRSYQLVAEGMEISITALVMLSAMLCDRDILLLIFVRDCTTLLGVAGLRGSSTPDRLAS